MKCPYRDFQDCIGKQCPSCNYEEVKKEVVAGRYPTWMSVEEAMNRGMVWKDVETTYRFIYCKLVDNNVQPVPANKIVVNNTTKTSVAIKRSIF